jgi:hypothetical protein
LASQISDNIGRLRFAIAANYRLLSKLGGAGMPIPNVDPKAYEKLSGKMMEHSGAAMGILMAFVGDQLGLYRALADHGPMSSDALARSVSCSPRYVREWLSCNAAGGYIEYNADTDEFSMTPEQALIFAGEGEVGCLSGFFQGIVACYLGYERNLAAFQDDTGIPWGDNHTCLFSGTMRCNAPVVEHYIAREWIPALRGVHEKLKAGAAVADVACGQGLSTVVMAQAYPNTRFYGFDFHGPSIEAARALAEERGVTNVQFETAAGKDFPNHGYDLVTVLHSLHDMGDPVGAARYIKSTLNDGGTLMLVEPKAGNALADNLHSLGQTLYAFSTLVCTPCSKSQEVGLALGAQAGPARLTAVLNEAGFNDVTLAAEAGIDMVMDAR